MTAEAMVLNETNSERSTLKKSAGYKKNGRSTSKLGNRRMTNKEIAEKHGECKVYDMNAFMTFDEFKEMPDDIQVEYVNKIQDQYHVGMAKISEIVFEQTDLSALRNWLVDRKTFQKCICSRKAPLDHSGEAKLIADVLAYRAKQKTEEAADVEFITFEAFYAMSDPEKVRYLNALVKKWDVSLYEIKNTLFNKSHKNLYYDAKKNGYLKDISHVSTKNVRAQRANCAAFRKAVEEWRGEHNEPTVESIKINGIDYAADTEDKTVYAIIVEEDPSKKEPIDIINEDPPAPETVNELEDPRIYHDSSYISSYVSIGLNEDEFNALALLFKNKKVRVKLEITEI